MKGIYGLILLATAALALHGCAVRPETLAAYGDVKLDGNVLTSFTVAHSEPAQLGKLPFCIASNVSNESVVVTDAANSYVGPYTGNYYQITSKTEIGGGNVLEYVSPDKNDVVAKGTTRYWAAMLERAVRYKLTVRDDGVSRTYRFSNVEVAQINSGYWPNSGFQRAPMNPGAGGGHVLKNLKQVAEEVDSCLRL